MNRYPVFTLFAGLIVSTCGCGGRCDIVTVGRIDTDQSIVVIPFLMHDGEWRTPVRDKQLANGILNTVITEQEDWATYLAIEASEAIRAKGFTLDRQWGMSMLADGPGEGERYWRDFRLSWYGRWQLGDASEGGFPRAAQALRDKPYSPDVCFYYWLICHEASWLQGVELVGDAIKAAPENPFARVFRRWGGKSGREILEKTGGRYLVTGEIIQYSEDQCTFIILCIDTKGAEIARGVGEAKSLTSKDDVRRIISHLLMNERGSSKGGERQGN